MCPYFAFAFHFRYARVHPAGLGGRGRVRLGSLTGLKVRAHHGRAVLTAGATLLPLKQFLEERKDEAEASVLFSCSAIQGQNKKRIVCGRATTFDEPALMYLQFRGSDPAGGGSRSDTGRSRLHGGVLAGVGPRRRLLRKVYRFRATRLGPRRCYLVAIVPLATAFCSVAHRGRLQTAPQLCSFTDPSQ